MRKADMATGADVSTVDGEGLSTRRERVGWYFYDWANSAFITTVVTVFLGPYLGYQAELSAGCYVADAPAGVDPCKGFHVHPLGIPVAPDSLFAYVISLSV